MGEVHTNDIETGGSQLVDGLNRVGLGTNSADDGGTTVIVLGGVCGIEGGEPFYLTTQVEVVEGICSDRLVALMSHGSRI